MRRLLPLLLLLPTPAFAVQPGDVIINELMIEPGSTAEWVELRNRAGEPVDLDDCQLETDSAVATFRRVSLDEGQFGVVSRGLGSCSRIDEDGDCAEPSLAVYDEAIDLLKPDVAEELRLVCGGDVIDSVPYDWSLHAGRCYGRQLCSVAVRPGAAATHDDFAGSWCIPAPADAVLTSVQTGGDELQLVASPGLPNGACAPDPCGAGDVIITELMIAPPSSYLREYVELKIRAPGGCDLHGCELREGPFADPLFEPLDPEWDVAILRGEGNTIQRDGGAYVLLGNPEEPDLLGPPVDLVGPGVSLADNDAGWLHLSCGANVLDSAPYDSDLFEPACAYDGCAVNLPAGREDFEAEGEDGNDSLDAWCVTGPDDTHTYSDDDGDVFQWSGTPGQPGRCERRAWPGEGDLVFTELLISPQNGSITDYPEWFELHNPTDAAVDLVGCTFERTRAPEPDGSVSTVSYTVPADGGAVSVEAGAVGLFTKSRCLDGADPADGPCAGDEFVIGSLSFTEAQETLSLRCPDGDGNLVVVDAFAYDPERTALRPGRALVYDGGTAAENDEPADWCEAATDECYAEDDRGRCNYGTPGTLSRCRTRELDVGLSGPAIRCSASGGGGWLGLLVLLGAIRRRR
jgi:hypothetical protein